MHYEVSCNSGKKQGVDAKSPLDRKLHNKAKRDGLAGKDQEKTQGEGSNFR